MVEPEEIAGLVEVGAAELGSGEVYPILNGLVFIPMLFLKRIF